VHCFLFLPQNNFAVKAVSDSCKRQYIKTAATIDTVTVTTFYRFSVIFCRLLQNYNCLQSCANSCPLCWLLDCSVPTYWWKGKTNWR